MPSQGKPRAIIEASLDIAVSPPVLWATFADLSKWSRWSPVVKSASWATRAEWTLGAEFNLAMDLPFPARHWSGIATITEVQPAVSVTWETQYPLDVLALHSYRFKPSTLGTLLTTREAYYGQWAWFYLLSGFPGRVQRGFDTALQNLKTYLEVGG